MRVLRRNTFQPVVEAPVVTAAAVAPEPTPAPVVIASPQPPPSAAPPPIAPGATLSARVTTPRNRLAHFALDANARVAEIFAERQRRNLPFLFRIQIQINDPARRMYLAWPGQSASIRTNDVDEAKRIVRSLQRWQEAIDLVGVELVDKAIDKMLKDQNFGAG